MSGGWQPLHHIEAEDPDEGAANSEKSPGGQRESKKGTQAPLSLTLNLPDDFTSAMKEVAKALTENTKAIRDFMVKNNHPLTKSPDGSTSEP